MTSSHARERPPLHEAVRDVYERRGSELFAFAWRLLESTSLAEDAVHEAREH